MKMYKQLGYRGMYHCGLPPEVDAYVTFRLMDNADLDVDQLLDEYFAGLYGAAAEPMRKLYLAIEKTYSDPKLRLKDKNVVPTSVDAAWGILGTARRMAEFGRLLDQARTAAVTDREKRNVELFNLGTWTYMTQGRARYVTRKAAPIPAVSAPAVPDASGDATKVAWDKAAALGGGWFERGSDRPAPRRLGGRIAHDATYLYVELTDPCATTNLVVSPGVACYDDWELFVSAKRALPYRQFLVGPTGLVGAMLQGEVNWRMNVPYREHGMRAASDTSAPDKWVTRLAIPLQEAVPGGAKPGDTIYLNVVRVSSPAVGGVGSFSIATWVSYTSVLEVDRSAEITLAP